MKLSAKIELVFMIGAILLIATGANAQRQMEKLGRGVVAVRTGTTTAYIGWRMLGTDKDDIGFNLYRSAAGGATVQLTTNQTQTTDFVDASADLTKTNSYFVRPVINGVEQAASASYTLPASAPTQQYISVPLQIPPGGTTPSGAYTYTANDCSVGDLDGDGEYEIVVKWDPSDAQDNSKSGFTGPVYLDAYKLNGTRLWHINLGPNIRAGAHYTQFMVYDLDGDGKAEVACKTAPGTKDGLGTNVVMGADNPSTVYTNSSGYILTGPEYLTIFNGQTGAALATTNYIPSRGIVADWGDSYGNRVDRFLACVAYLDGVRPSLVMCRGYYTGTIGSTVVGKTVLAAWDWRNGQLTQRWTFSAIRSTNSAASVNIGYTGQGNHNLSVGDVDGDGKDEIMYGACAINHDGTGLYTTGLGHGDAMHMSDMDPDRPGLEVWDIHETPNLTCGGGEFRDARTGALIFGLPSTNDYGRGCAGNITPVKGYQMWSGATNALFNCKGQNIGTAPSQKNFMIWWDADLLREILDGTTIYKWDWNGGTNTTLLSPAGLASNNGTKATPCLSADIFGDWREEVIWRVSATNNEIRIYTTTTPATNRFYTLMHDPQYREAIAWQNVAYNQPPHPSFYLGYGMAKPPVAPVSDAKLVWHGDGVGNTWDVTTTTNWYANWQLSGIWTSNTAAVFGQGDTVLFDLSGSNTPPVNLVGTLLPGAVTVYTYPPIDYVFAGSGSLGGTTTLVKAGTGTLTINTTNTYTGSTTVSDGTLILNGSFDQSPVTIESRGTLQIGNGGATGALGTNNTVNNGMLAFNRSDAITNGAAISGSGRLIQLGSGTLKLTSSNTFSGGTTISNGTLLVNNTTGSGTGTGAVTVTSTGTLGGTGVIAGPVAVNGTLAPGSPDTGVGVGTLTVSNNLVVNAGAVLAYELGAASDKTVVSSNLTLTGTLNVSNAGGFGAGTYTLFTYGGTLAYSGLSTGSAPSGYDYNISTNTAGQVNLVVTSLLTPFEQWQINYFGSTTNPLAAAGADPDGDGMSNTNEFLAGTNPTNSLSGLRILSVVQQTNDVVITWATAGGRTNAVQATAGDGSGGYSTNFNDISGSIVIPGAGDATTNYVDAGGATNTPARYYRIRLGP